MIIITKVLKNAIDNLTDYQNYMLHEHGFAGDPLNKNRKFPSIDLGRCSECLGCIEVAPNVFRYNSATGKMEVIDLDNYQRDVVEEAMKNCPKDCISWE